MPCNSIPLPFLYCSLCMFSLFLLLPFFWQRLYRWEKREELVGLKHSVRKLRERLDLCWYYCSLLFSLFIYEEKEQWAVTYCSSDLETGRDLYFFESVFPQVPEVQHSNKLTVQINPIRAKLNPMPVETMGVRFKIRAC